VSAAWRSSDERAQALGVVAGDEGAGSGDEVDAAEPGEVGVDVRVDGLVPHGEAVAAAPGAVGVEAWVNGVRSVKGGGAPRVRDTTPETECLPDQASSFARRWWVGEE
jgi:hypothetical protein